MASELRQRIDLKRSVRTVARLARIVEVALAGVGLTVAQYRVLARLTEGELGASELASSLLVKPSSLTSVVDGLVARGLIARSADPADRRRVDHALTAEGRAQLAACDKAVERSLATVLSHAPPGRAAHLVAGLEGIGDALEAHRRASRTARP